MDNFSKIPPQARDLEEAVIGALLIDKYSTKEVIGIIDPSSFYVEANKLIFEAIIHLYNSFEPIDILTVVEHLHKTDKLELVGGAYYLTQLSSKVVSSANAVYHARIIKQKEISRQLISLTANINSLAYNNVSDPFELLDTLRNSLKEITNKINTDKTYLSSDIANKIVKQGEENRRLGVTMTGLGTGFRSLDRKISGLNKSDLIIIAARPGMGKTALMMNFASFIASSAIPVGIFSLEMSAEQLITRLLSSESGINSNEIRLGTSYVGDLEMARIAVNKMPMVISDKGGLKLNDLIMTARKMADNNKVQVIFIDYLQKIVGTKKDKRLEIAEISGELKNLAKELEIPIIALSQLSREVEKRGDKRPMLSDLIESGAIEADADVVIFPYRAEYYGAQVDQDGNSVIGMAELIIAKNRHGEIGTIEVGFKKEVTKFHEIEHFQNSESPF